MAPPHHLIGFLANSAERMPCLLRHYREVSWLEPADGIQHFGVGRYSADHSFLLRDSPRQLSTALTPLDLLSEELETHLLIAHASSASPADEDTQPFRYQDWLLALQGVIELPTDKRAELVASLPAPQRRAREGSGDAELIFLHLIAALSRDGLLGAPGTDEGLIHRLRQSMDLARVPVNLLASNGRDLIACCTSQPLHYCLFEGLRRCEPCRVGEGYSWIGPGHRSHQTFKGVCVASRRLDFAESWQEIAVGQMLVIDASLGLRWF